MTDAPKPQADKFRDLARELECDEDEAAFEHKVRKVATAPKADQEPAPK
jgi:hypothetical protein